jgi:hypothetical protein
MTAVVLVTIYEMRYSSTTRYTRKQLLKIRKLIIQPQNTPLASYPHCLCTVAMKNSRSVTYKHPYLNTGWENKGRSS